MTRRLSALVVARRLDRRRTYLVAQTRVPQPGEPLPGLSPTEFAEFRLGLDDFLEVETSDEGLGPAFNGTSCAVCHNVPAVGGGGVILELRAARRNAEGEFEPLDPSGETLFQLFSVPGHGCQVDRCQMTPPSSRGGFRFRSLAPASSRRSATSDCWRSKILPIAIATASAAGRRA